ncbi:hypothetical protein VIBNIAM115_330006 [Vibrio nigripulchritudo AM115]|nr:hypothetical protein VIBNIAM115_330006 [Vibrio nigripulchritudo AM115]
MAVFNPYSKQNWAHNEPKHQTKAVFERPSSQIETCGTYGRQWIDRSSTG